MAKDVEKYNIPSKTRTGGYYDRVVYTFTFESCATACVAKYGSLYNMIKQKRNHRLGDDAWEEKRNGNRGLRDCIYGIKENWNECGR